MYIISVSILVIVSILNCFRHKYDRSTSQCPEFFILNFAGFLLFGPTVCVLSVSREKASQCCHIWSFPTNLVVSASQGRHLVGIIFLSFTAFFGNLPFFKIDNSQKICFEKFFQCFLITGLFFLF